MELTISIFSFGLFATKKKIAIPDKRNHMKEMLTKIYNQLKKKYI